MKTSKENDVRRRALWLGARVRLLDLRLRRIDAELQKPTPDGPIDLKLDVKPAVSRVDHLAIYDLEYTIAAKDADGSDVLGGSVSLSLVYELPVDESVSDDDLATFGSVCVLFVAHPYLREILHSLTGRMGLPPLMLDLMQLPLDGLIDED